VTRDLEQAVTFRSPDGLLLAGSLLRPSGAPLGIAVLVHGGGVSREEGGFFTRLAHGLAEAGVASLRFDFRAHGESQGRMEDLTIAGILGDIRTAASHAASAVGTDAMVLVGASFGGGISALFAARHPEQVRGLVLFNPLLDYKNRFIDQKPYWHDDQIDEEAGRRLAEDGYLEHSPTFRLGRPLLNEVFYLRPDRELGAVTAPALIVHGTKDTFIPVDSSRAAIGRFGGEARLVTVDGAQHGIAVHDDPTYADPQTQIWQASVIRRVADWACERLRAEERPSP